MRITLTRALVSTFWLATAVYALLSAIPFVWTQFLEPKLVPGVAAFADHHKWISMGALALTASGLSPWLRRGNTSVWALVSVWAVTIIVEFATPGLPGLSPSSLALFVSVAALAPAVWLALLELRSPTDIARAPIEDADPLGDLLACAGAAFVVTVAHASPPWSAGGAVSWLSEMARSATLHLFVFTAVFGMLSVVRGGARMIDRRGLAESWVGRAVVAAVLAIVLNRVLLAAVSFTGPSAWLLASAFGAALALQLGPASAGAPLGINGALHGLVPTGVAGSPVRTALWLVVAMACVIGIETGISGSDWNFAVATMVAVASWLVALAAMLRLAPWLATIAPTLESIRVVAPFAAAALVLVLYQVARPNLLRAADASVVDASSRFIAGALSPAATAPAELHEFLHRNTNIPHDVAVAPVEVAFATLTTPSVRRPHIFLFVVDSLRRDYLQPYNAAVSFTPAINQFAAESAVFERAFSRYGGTGLALPSIWVGGLLLHKQYVTPFGPMNALAKLLASEQYEVWVSKERILDTILPASTAIVPLDAGLPVKDHRFCRTLEEVRTRLDRLSPDRPTFVYSLPQDIHVSTIAREGSTPVDANAYSGFHAAYASRVRRFDACFGAFVADLKARALYDQSIIIVTSDHGDSLGEQGRIGHAYTIFPEVIQVPLLVHLPADLQTSRVADLRAAAFTSDITPSLYALLGHSPVAPAAIFGRPLFRGASSRAALPRGAEVVASSYGSVYGALLDDARRLYIIDSVSFREFMYELDGSGAGREIKVGRGDREAGQHAIRAAVDEIARFYLGHAPDTPPRP